MLGHISAVAAPPASGHTLSIDWLLFREKPPVRFKQLEVKESGKQTERGRETGGECKAAEMMGEKRTRRDETSEIRS